MPQFEIFAERGDNPGYAIAPEMLGEKQTVTRKQAVLQQRSIGTGVTTPLAMSFVRMRPPPAQEDGELALSPHLMIRAQPLDLQQTTGGLLIYIFAL